MRNTYQMHPWTMKDKDVHVGTRIDVDNVPVSNTSEMRSTNEATLWDRPDATQTTLQSERNACGSRNFV